MVLVMEINLNALLNIISNNNFKFVSFSCFPSVKCDLSLIIDDNTKIDEIMILIKKSGGYLVRDVNVFDLYNKENYQDKKSVLFQLFD